MAEVRGLAQAIGQVTGQALQIKREEDARELRQAEIDTSNTIIREALDMDANLTGKDVTPFVKQKKIFEFIADRERKEGLQTGTALGAYKQFFSLGAVGSAGADIKKWHKKEFGDAGVLYVNPNDPTQRQFIEYDPSYASLRDLKDSQKALGKDTMDILTDGGLVELYGVEKVHELTRNVQSAMQDPIASKLILGARRRSILKDRLVESENYGKLALEEKKQAYRDSGASESLTNFANTLIEMTNKHGGITLPDTLSRFNREVTRWSQEDPQAWKAISGDLVPMLEEYITKAHPSVQYKAGVGEQKDRLDYVNQNNAIMESVARNVMYKRDKRAVDYKVAADTLRSVSFPVLKSLEIGTGKKSRDMLTDLGDMLFHIGEDDFKEAMTQYEGKASQMFTKLDPSKEDFNPAEDPAMQGTLDLIQLMYKPETAQTPNDTLRFSSSVKAIMSDPNKLRKLNEGLDRLTETEDMLRPENYQMLRRINGFRDLINRKE